jgi:hypothetical protein
MRLARAECDWEPALTCGRNAAGCDHEAGRNGERRPSSVRGTPVRFSELVGVAEVSRDASKSRATVFVNNVVPGVRRACSEFGKIRSRLTQRQVVRSRDHIRLMQSQTIVFPEADGANVVFSPAWEREVVAYRTLVDRVAQFRE